MSIYRLRLLAQLALIPRPIAAWSAKGKTNEDEDRAILKDLTGNGHDITLNNMAFSGMSGYGGYTVYKFIIIEDRFEGEYSNYKITVNKLLLSNTNISFISYSTTVVDISFKLQISGLPDGVSLKVWDHSSLEYLLISTNGVHTISLLNQNYSSTYIGLNGVTTEGTYNITIELLPEYPDALVFDGVDDYGICENIPILTDYTVITKRKYVSGKSGIIQKAAYGGGNTFILEGGDSTNSVWSFGDLTFVNAYNEKDISYLTPISYNGLEISKGGNTDKSTILTLGTIRPVDTRFWNGAFYCAYLFGRTLSEQEIKTFIRANIDPLYMLPSEIPENEPIPDCYYDFSLGSNEDENRETIVDYSGNGNNAVAHNFTWSGMSGYGGYVENFNNWIYSPSFGVVEILLSNVIIIKSFLSDVASLYKTYPAGSSAKLIFNVSGITNDMNITFGGYKGGGNYSKKVTNGINNFSDFSITGVTSNVGFRSNTIIESCNITIELLPEYPGALVLDGVDDYISLDFPTGYKTVFMTCEHLTEALSVLYDQRTVDSNGKFSIEATLNGKDATNNGDTFINNVNTTGAIPNNKKVLIYATNNNITEETIRLSGTTIGCRCNNGLGLHNALRIYKFLGFKEYLDEELILYVINKYNLLEGVDELESSEV